jgi:drug/metabolite transporter (DMT)-like permease
MNALFGVLGSLLIGASDFFGSRSSERSGSLATVTVAFWVGAAFLAVLSVIGRYELSTGTLALGAVSGVGIALGLWSIYAGFSASSVAVVAPVAAVVSAVGPVVADVAQGDPPSRAAVAGSVIGLSGLLIATWGPHGRNVGIGLVYGVVAGIGFALALVSVAETDVEAGLWPVVPQRVVSGLIVSCVAIVLRRPLLPKRGSRLVPAVGGAFGSAGVGAIAIGTQRGAITPVAVAGSFYPVVTIVLRWLFDGEALTRRQVAGLTLAVSGIVLITLG